ncbi:glutamyl-tRNA reductase-binding protein, chloroplastic [Dorcoceras hygrometricum]|uniref:Glutamyl-tRNA reductase-binding protein, chloroplastic n=1 Tax=Dorcoceras hygrometricum TaxID=472368 RepID=A0A2Z7CFC8_9LAMI|nr:glutamyl-tRNA reductase-binding protein, chloroplastic [Dorcoceras hygrometricum]
MLLHIQSLAATVPPPLFPATHSPLPLVSLSRPRNRAFFGPLKANKLATRKPLKCSVSVSSEPLHLQSTNGQKPIPAEVSRTIMELSTSGTLSTLTPEGWPLGFGVRFAVDANGTPILCLNDFGKIFPVDWCSLHVQLEQCGVRTPQCTIQGNLEKPGDRMALRKLYSAWKKRFNEEVDESYIYTINVDRVLQMQDFDEDGIWVTSLEYSSAEPDPLRNCAEKIVDEINTHNFEDIFRFSNVFVDLDFKVLDAKMVWIDRLGFDLHLRSVQKDVYEVRIPFPREVADEKGAKSSFSGMSQLAWEVEKHYHIPEFSKVKHLKKISNTAILVE